MKLSLVVPCYNEEDVVYDFYKETNKVFADKVDSYEFVFVNDGSKDKTYEILKAIHKVSDNVKVINFSRNFGKEAAMYAGLCNTTGDYTCVIDADLQQRPEVVLEMLHILENDSSVDCIAAYQESRKESKVVSLLKNGFYKLMNVISEVEFYPGASDFRLMRRKMVDEVVKLTEYHRFSKGLFSFVGFNTKYIPYEVQQRAAGESKWSVAKLFIYAVEGIVGYTTAPLKLATFAGIGFVAAAFIYLVIALIAGIISGSLSSAVAIITLLLLIGGIQFIFTGVIGEYLARAYMQGKNRPVFIVKEMLTYEDEESE
ncbi:MAG: glycosyltransferase family 2 protein [Clostridia bacterium]|nr:glycosyltransferase family 2 protein [Clostridia bacterium]